MKWTDVLEMNFRTDRSNGPVNPSCTDCSDANTEHASSGVVRLYRQYFRDKGHLPLSRPIRPLGRSQKCCRLLDEDHHLVAGLLNITSAQVGLRH